MVLNRFVLEFSVTLSLSLSLSLSRSILQTHWLSLYNITSIDPKIRKQLSIRLIFCYPFNRNIREKSSLNSLLISSSEVFRDDEFYL